MIYLLNTLDDNMEINQNDLFSSITSDNSQENIDMLKDELSNMETELSERNLIC